MKDERTMEEVWESIRHHDVIIKANEAALKHFRRYLDDPEYRQWLRENPQPKGFYLNTA